MRLKPVLLDTIIIFKFVENCLQFDAIHDILVWLRTGSKPPDINRFRSYTAKWLLENEYNIWYGIGMEMKLLNIHNFSVVLKKHLNA